MNGWVAGFVAVAGVLAGYFILGFGPLGSALLGSGLFVGLAAVAAWRSVSARRRQLSADSSAAESDASAAGTPQIEVDLDGLNITQEEFSAALRNGAVKLAALKRAAERISDPSVRGKAYAVCDAVARILSTIREDPKDLRPARKFLDYYLDATVKVVDRYAALANKSIGSHELQDALRRTEESLDTIKHAYDRQLAQLLENDVMDLDTELKVLERTIQMEGLGD